MVIGAHGGLIGSGEEESSTGLTYLIYGPTSGAMDLHDADAILYGDTETFSSYTGYSLSSTGDFNADGLSDLLIGAPYYTLKTEESLDRVGMVYVVSGRER